MVEISFLPAAEVDYEEALACYQERSAQAATGFEAAIEVALRAIAVKPGSWTRCDERHRYYTLRRYPYSIFYRLDGEKVLVVAVAHAKRSEFYWHGRE